MATADRIEINPAIMLGKPVIKGTRIPVELILRKLAEGATQSELLDAYPRLTGADIQAAIAHAADTLAHDETILTPCGPAMFGLHHRPRDRLRACKTARSW